VLFPPARGELTVDAWHLFFTGQVQGVGFRYTCCQASREFNVSGWVCNLADGRVEMLIEGPSLELQQFLDCVHERNHGIIRDLQKAKVAVTGRFADFQIRND